MRYRVYTNALKKEICRQVCDEKQSTKQVAMENDIPLKTVEKWVTKYYKDSTCFDHNDDFNKYQSTLDKNRYENLEKEELIKELKRRDNRISYLECMIKLNSEQDLGYSTER